MPQKKTTKTNKTNLILISVIVLLLGALAFVSLTDYKPSLDFIKTSTSNGEVVNDDKESTKPVKLDFYVMSQCPYGTQVEDAIAPVMKKMEDVIDLNIEYILYPASNYAGQEETYCIDGLCSMHGVPEVKGNIAQLCVNDIAPAKGLDFISCQNKDMNSIPNNWESCVDELELDKAKIQECYEGESGIALLTASNAKSVAVSAQGSPTIFMNDKPYQGGRTPVDFQRAACQVINNEHEACKNLPACSVDQDCTAEAEKVGKCIKPGEADAKCEYSEAQKVSLTILGDARCTKPECSTKEILGQIKQTFKGVSDVIELDYSSEEGKALYTDSSLENLPAYLFGKEVETAYFYNDLKTYLKSRGEYYELEVGATYNPTKEICDNEIDDTGNGAIDCVDSDCSEELVCRTEEKAKLDLFVMSQCPYGTKALDIMPAVLEAFKDEITFNVNFIATETEPGKFNALHGQPEVDENIRELCVIKNYSENYKYMDYIVCRDKDIKSTEWEGCATEAGMDVSTIKTCSEGEEGINLHSENIKFANSIGVAASPTWLANNKYQFSGIDAATVQTEICKYNPELKGCAVTLSEESAGAAVPAGSCN